MKKSKKQFNTRLKIVFAGIITVGFVLVTNLFYIQIRTGEQLRAQADGQYIVSTFNSFERGNIFFETKDSNRITAAGQKNGYKISINPSRLSEEDLDEVYIELHKFSDINKNYFSKRIKNRKRTYVEIINKLSKEDGKKIKKELGKKVSLHAEKWRTYPLKRAASHVVGFLGYDDSDEYNGRYGLESYYNKTLLREDKSLYTNFFARTFHGVRNLIDSDKKLEGNIISSIDPQIQLFLEGELSKIQKKWSSQSTGGIIMNPKNGEIYAMASMPNFDGNDYSKESLSRFKNPLVSNVYEFGSIMKPLVAAVGLDLGVINAATEYYDKGSVKVGKHTIYNFDKRGRGLVNMQDVLNQSLNTGMVFISKKIPKKSFREYFKKYGFGTKSGVDLPSDVSGLASNLKSNRDIEFANISFGQGLAISPLSFIKAASALANNGKTVVPHVIKRIEYTNGMWENIDMSDRGEQVLKPETSAEISRMMVNVFDHYRKGKAKLPNHRVAVKTGTAQVANPRGGYYTDRNLHSFLGYFPVYDPEFIILLYTVNPKGIKYSSQTLLDPFRDTAKYLINYHNIPPDR